MKPITLDILVACGASRTYGASRVALYNELLPYYKITTHLRLSHFLGQVIHECNGYRNVVEIASGQAYEGRVDLGNVHPGDGVKYKGRGDMQTTGLINYRAFARKFGIDCVEHPELLEEPRWACATALYYWGTRNLNSFADKDDTLGISQLINMGHISRSGKLPNGWAERQRLVAKAKVALKPLFA